MNIVWSPEAIEDLIALRAYVGADDRAAARRLAMRIVDAVETSISRNPEIGRPGRVVGTREFVIARSPISRPIASAAAPSKCYAFCTAPADGLNGFET